MTDIVDELLRDEITVGHGQREVRILSIQAAAVIQTLRAKVEQLEREAVEHRAQIQRAQDTVLETLEDLNAAHAKNESLQEALGPFAERINLLDQCKNASKYAVSTDIDVEHLRHAREILKGETK